MKVNKQFLRQVVMYGIIGGSSAALDTFIFILLCNTTLLNAFIANIISIHCGILTSFCLNRKFNFHKMDKVFFRAASFYLTGFLGLMVSSGILWVGKYLEIPVSTVKIVSVFIVAVTQFSINKLVAFGK